MPLKHIAIVSMEHKFQKDVIIGAIASALLLFNKRKLPNRQTMQNTKKWSIYMSDSIAC